MGIIAEEEKKRIAEEEEIRCQVRRKYEQKSSGVAAVLSTVCPGMGQVYNGQIGKASVFFLCFVIGLTILSLGSVTLVKGPSSSSSFNITGSASVLPEKPVEMNEEGIIPEAVDTGAVQNQTQQKAGTEKLSREQKSVIKALAMVGLGAIVAILAILFAIRDAILTAKRKNRAATA